MDYLKASKSFLNSHALAEGFRITVGVTIPALVLGYLNQLPAGIVVSVGALCVGLTDNPGPIHHRKNGMLACNLLIFFVALLTGFAAGSPVLLGIVIALCCFVFSMLAVYGSRATSIGVASLLVMVLNLQKVLTPQEVFINALYILAGGTWYMLMSLLLYRLRPYKLVQQALGECLQATAGYLRIKASFYQQQVDDENTYRLLLEKQVDVHTKQELVRELIFKSRELVKESTATSRILVMIFLDGIDLFEQATTSHQDYSALHKEFDDSGILEKYHLAVLMMADEIEHAGIDVKSGNVSPESSFLTSGMKNLRIDFERLRDERRNSVNLEAFIALRQVTDILEQMAGRIRLLHSYTGFDKKLVNEFDVKTDYRLFTSHQDFSAELFLDNLSFKSNTFRHALRVTVATITGYLLSLFFPFGHSYWVLLTIIVILKPAYSLTKRRNWERLGGTVLGAGIGLLLLYTIHDRNVQFICMIFLMIGSYSFLRTRYLVSILFMTPYILLLFHLLHPGDYKTILTDRILDTAAGSIIAWIANLFVFPAWEQDQITELMTQVLEKNTDYYRAITARITGGNLTMQQYRYARKEAYVASANLSDAFNRMLNEPKNKQQNIKSVHPFVVSNHLLLSHIATLAFYMQPEKLLADTSLFMPVIEDTLSRLAGAGDLLAGKSSEKDPVASASVARALSDRLNTLLEKRKAELDQGITESYTRNELAAWKPLADRFLFILKTAEDIERVSGRFMMGIK